MRHHFESSTVALTGDFLCPQAEDKHEVVTGGSYDLLQDS